MFNFCNYTDCKKRATYGLKRNEPIRCKLHKENMDLCSRICICGMNRPSFNEPGETIPICCNSCKTPNMVNVSNKKCQCQKAIPVFNYPGESIAICCKSCKSNEMVDIKSYMCPCGNRPTYNYHGQSKPMYCKSCKNKDMINVKSKRCDCGKHTPSYNEPGEDKPTHCSSCKSISMINVKHTRCYCRKAYPSYNYPGQSKPMYCASCKDKDMTDVVNRRCYCGKHIASYNEPGEDKATHCSSCKSISMINVRSNKCICDKRPTFNEPGETVGRFCDSCRSPSMVDVVHSNCLGLINDAGVCPFGSRGNPKYNDYCAECFRRNFPLDPLTFQIRSKTKEIAVRDYINANFEGFQHDKIMTTSHCDCSIKRRIDHRYLINNTLLVVETDENQHKSYDKMDEEIRYDDLYMAFSGKWIYIRFNPDKYISNKGIRKNPTIASRLPILKEEIQKQLSRIKNNENTELLERIYMYYDKYD